MKKVLLAGLALCMVNVSLLGADISPNRMLLKGAQLGDIDILNDALAIGADVNVQAADRTALIWAATFGYDAIVDRLINAGAELNVQDSGGHTALMWAAMSRRDAIVDRLINAGVDLHIKNASGQTALDIAKNSGYEKIVQRLEQAKAQELKTRYFLDDGTLTMIVGKETELLNLDDDEALTYDTFEEILDDGRRLIEVITGDGKFHHYFEQKSWEAYKEIAGAKEEGELIDPLNRQPVESEKDVTDIIKGLLPKKEVDAKS